MALNNAQLDALIVGDVFENPSMLVTAGNLQTVLRSMNNSYFNKIDDASAFVTTSGTNAAGQVAYFSSSGILAGTNDFFWDTTKNALNLNGAFFAKQDTSKDSIYLGSLPPFAAGSNNILLQTGGSSITSASQTSIFGALAGISITTGLNNTLMGYNSGSDITTGQNNTVMGVNALQNLRTGMQNTVVGSAAAPSVTTSDSNITLVGYGADTLSAGFNNAIAIGSGAIAQSSNSFTLGNDSVSKYRFHAVNYVFPAAQGAASTTLLNDGAGNLSWATLSSSVLTTPLTGFSATNAAITAADNVLQAFDHAQGQISFIESNYLPLTGGVLTGFLTLNADPTNASHAATKAYVDNIFTGINWKTSVSAATTANITLSGTQTIDGYAANIGDRILVKSQTAGADNGIYTVAAGAWSRSTDAATAAEILSATVYVRNGTVNMQRQYTCNNSSITLGTTSITFALIAGAGTYTNGTYLKLTSNVFDIDFTAFSTSQITEGTGLYFTNARARAAIALTTTGTSAAATYNTSTGVLNVPIYQAQGNYITALTGDATASGAGSAALTLATVNTNTGTFNNVTVNGKGLVTAATNVAYLTTVSLTTNVTGILPIANGGTNNNIFATGSVTFFDGTKITENNSHFFWDNTNMVLLTGTGTNLADITTFTTGFYSTISEKAISVYRKDTTVSAGATLDLYKRGNTGAATGAVASGSVIANMTHWGWNGATFIAGADITSRATQAWAVGANGASLTLSTTPNGSATIQAGLFIDNTQDVAINANTFDSTNPERLKINAGTTTSVNAAYAYGTLNNYFQYNIKNSSNGIAASSDVVCTADTGNETSNYVNLGINGSANSSAAWGGALDAYLYASDGNLSLGAMGAKSVYILAGGGASTNRIMSITSTSVAYTDTINIAFGTASGTIIATSVSQKMAFWGATPVIQPKAAAQASVAAQTQQALTDNTAGTVSTTLAAIITVGTNLLAAAATADVNTALGTIRNTLSSLAAQLAKIDTDIANIKTLQNQTRLDLVATGLQKGAA